MKELSQLKARNTYRVVKRSEMEKVENHLIVGTRMVVVNKGTLQEPRIKARLVAQEFRTSEMQDELFAGTPGVGAPACFVFPQSPFAKRVSGPPVEYSWSDLAATGSRLFLPVGALDIMRKTHRGFK